MALENEQGQTNRIWEVLKKLELFPESHQDWLVGRYADKGYKQLMIDNHIAIYRNEKETKFLNGRAVDSDIGCPSDLDGD